MNQLKHLGHLPKSLRVLIKSFLDTPAVSGYADPAVFEMSETELLNLSEEEGDIVFQLILDREYKRWYLVAVGDYQRTRKSELLLPEDKMTIRRSLLAFSEVDESWIRNKRAEAIRSKMIREEPFEFDPGRSVWI